MIRCGVKTAGLRPKSRFCLGTTGGLPWGQGDKMEHALLISILVKRTWSVAIPKHSKVLVFKLHAICLDSAMLGSSRANARPPLKL